MKYRHGKIGFDDRPVMLIGIPLLSFIIPIVFAGCRFDREPYFDLNRYFTTFFITSVLWICSRYIMIWNRRMYPSFRDVRKRLITQSVSMLLFTIIGNNVLGYIVDTVLLDGPNRFTNTDALISTNSAAVFCTIMIMAIYESIYFMNELKNSVEEKETLKRESLNAQLNALRTQVNPHFLFNNLNTLSSIIP